MDPTQSVLPSQPNYLTPQQRSQMAMYSSQLANRLPPATSVTGGIGNMLTSFMNGMPQQGNGFLNSLSDHISDAIQDAGDGNNSPMQLPSANGGASGPPMQLPSANGGGSPLGIFQGLFGGNNGSTS